VEKVTKRNDSVQLVSVSVSCNDPYFMIFNLSSTRASIYYQWSKSGSITYTGSILSKALKELIDLKPFCWPSHYDLNTIQCTYKHSSQDELEINYVYHQQDTSTSAAVDIHQNYQPRRHSGSWDHDRYNQTVRKNKFLSSSLVFTTTSPQLRPTSTSRASFPDSRQMMISWTTDDEEEDLDSTHRLNHHKDTLRLEVKDKFNLIISLPQNQSWSDRFAQLCVSCYRRMSDNDYVIQIVHPQKLIRYLQDDLQDEGKQLDDELSGSIHVSLSLKRSDNGQCMVNNREWPIRAWTMSSDEEEEDDDDDEEEADVAQDEQDIFVDGMEELGHETLAPIVKKVPPVMKPSSSAPVPRQKSVDVYTQPSFISDHHIPAVALSPPPPVIMKTSQSQTTTKKKHVMQDMTPRFVVIHAFFLKTCFQLNCIVVTSWNCHLYHLYKI
jgi:hypothetical protein